MANREKLAEFVAWSQKHITGDEKGQAQIFLDRLFQSFGQPGCLVGGATEFRIRKSDEDGGGTTAFAMPSGGTQCTRYASCSTSRESAGATSAPGAVRDCPPSPKSIRQYLSRCPAWCRESCSVGYCSFRRPPYK